MCKRRPRMAMPTLVRWLLLLAVFSVCQLRVGASVCVEADRDSLLAFKAGVVDLVGVLESWDPSESCCGWLGVVCNAAGHVTEVQIDELTGAGLKPGVWLRRSIDAIVSQPDLVGRTLGGIKTLQVLKLSFIDLKRDVYPKVLLPQLRIVALRGVNLLGPIPLEWGSWNQLRFLNVSRNGFTGGLPVQLCSLSRLEVLELSVASGQGKERLTGGIPACLGSLPSLKTLVLSFNGLSGQIPLSRGSFGRLEVLKLDHNQFSGGISEALGYLSKLKVLHLQGNVALSREIPRTISLLTALQELIFGGSGDGGSGDELFELFDDLFSEAKGLGGDLSALQLNKLTQLRVLHIRGTSLGGSIPASVGSLTKLVDLRLDHNNLQGSIPSTIGQLTKLEQLFLRYNRLTGSLPPSIGLLPKIENLLLNRNSLSDKIPATFAKLSARTINLSFNNLQGDIPSGLGSIANSSSFLGRELDLSWNKLTGQFPASLLDSGLSSIRLSRNLLSSLPQGPLRVSQRPELQLRTLFVDFNLLTGLLPPWVFQLPSLATLDLSNNQLKSPFPSFVASFVGITNLNLSKNYFGGNIPNEFTQLTTVELLDLSDNRFEGSIPPNIGGTLSGERSSLGVLDLSKNRLHGGLPAGIFNVLQALRLSNNRLSGPILGGEKNASSVGFNFVYLDLANNFFSGSIPLGVGNLQKVSLGGNRLTGQIPAFSCQNSGLQHLSFENNQLTGPAFPASLRACTILVSYDVSGNRLTGRIPELLKLWQSLQVLRISKNNLVGTFPDWIASLPALEYLDVSHNRFSGALPLGRFHAFPAIREPIEFISPEDTRPLSRYLLRNVFLLLVQPTLDFSDNLFTGDISPNVGSLLSLEYLDISRNQVADEIPDTLSRAAQLRYLDVSRNRLVGNIPPSLIELTYLRFVNFSFNNLSGPIPQSLKWATFPVSSFINNSLCGRPISDRCLAEP